MIASLYKKHIFYSTSTSNTVLLGAEEHVADFLRTCQARNLIRTVWIILHEMCTNVALCTALKRATLITDKNVNRLELRKLGTEPGYDTGPRVVRHPASTVFAVEISNCS